MRTSKGSKERADTRYIGKPRGNMRTGATSTQILLDPDCIRARRQERKRKVGKKLA